MKIFNADQIKRHMTIAHDVERFINSQKSAFIEFSSGLYTIPFPMQFIFSNQASDCHIKGGYRSNSKYFVVKVAGSNKSGNRGSILVFGVEHCELIAILHDNGLLTTLRTAVAGLIVLQTLPWKPKNIGIIGSGSLAGQLHELVNLKYPQSNIFLYARNKSKASSISDLQYDSIEGLAAKCDVIFTATSSHEPLIHDIPKNKQIAIVLLGSDDEYKSEILPQLFKKVDLVVVDSKIQATKYGDVSRALKRKFILEDNLIELGEALNEKKPLNAKTIMADLSGIGAQDVAITDILIQKMLDTTEASLIESILAEREG